MTIRITVNPDSPAEDAFKNYLKAKADLQRKLEKAASNAQLKPV